MNPSFFSGFNSGLTLDSFSNFDPVAAFARSNPYLASLGLSSQGQNQVNNVNNMLNGGPGYGLQNLPSGFSFASNLSFPDLGPIDQDALNANMQQGGFTPGMSGQQMQSQIQQNIANAQPAPAPTPAPTPMPNRTPSPVPRGRPNVVSPITYIGTQFDAQQPQSPFQQGSGPGASTPFVSAFDSQLQNAQTGNATGALQTQLQNFQSSNLAQALPQTLANGGRAGYAKGKLVKKAIEGIASLFKNRGKYFNPTSQEFGEVSTLLKGSPKNKLVSDEQMLEAEVMQRMMADPSYSSFRKSVLGESAEDDVLENLQNLIGKDPQVINPKSARGKKMMREMQFFPKQNEGITGAKAVNEESDRILKTMQDMEAQSKNMLTESTFLLDEQKLKNEALDMFMREIDDGFEPTAALERMIRKIKMSRTKQADGGRVGLLSGGLLKKLFKRGLAGAPDDVAKDVDEMMLMRPKATMGMDPSKTADAQQFKNVMRDPNTDLERILKDRADGTKATPLDAKTVRELESLVQDSPRYSPEQKTAFFKLIDIEKIRADHLYNTGEELPDHVLEMLYREGAGDFNKGGRVGMALGGGITTLLNAAAAAGKLAARGFKPFGAKQTYKQNVKMTGMDELQKGMKKQFDVELYKIDKGRAGNPETELFDLYEDIVSGKRYSMLPQATRSKMITKIEESMKNNEVDGADYQNFRSYLFDEYKFPNETAFVDDIRRGIDKGQIKTMKAEDLLDALDKESGANVIPFKPKTKKANGGTVPPLKGPASDGMGSLFRRK